MRDTTIDEISGGVSEAVAKVIPLKKLRWISFGHVEADECGAMNLWLAAAPHAWEAGIFYEETDKTLFCGDLFTHVGDGPPLVRSEILGPAAAAEDVFHATSIGPLTAAVLRQLADFSPKTLALMHGSSFAGDCAGHLNGLAHYYDDALRKAIADRP